MKILVVDDSKAMRKIVARTLKQAGFEQHAVEEAENGAQAFDAIKAAPPDLVLSDWNMPEMNGIELLQKLRTEGNAVKFGFVTTEGTPEMRKLAMDSGALFLIAKPFTPETFQQVLQPVLAT
ncbi:MAG: response regulator [Planctomycetes bacterium]|nr:response regulator [Planctomycetota bacterium]